MNTPTTTAKRRSVQHHLHPPEPSPGPPPRAVLDLGTVPTAPGCARAWTREILREWSITRISGTVELIVSELTTNAVRTSRQVGQPSIRLILTLDQGELAILVRDYCPGIPQPGNARADDEGGRGLLLVQAMSDRSGWYPAEDGTPGKVVWAVARPEFCGT